MSHNTVPNRPKTPRRAVIAALSLSILVVLIALGYVVVERFRDASDLAT